MGNAASFTNHTPPQSSPMGDRPVDSETDDEVVRTNKVPTSLEEMDSYNPEEFLFRGGSDSRPPSKETLERAEAAKLYISQYYAKLGNNISERLERRKQLEEAIDESNLSTNEQNKLLDVYQEKENEFLRLRRRAMMVTDFHMIKVIGRGSFGEVRLVRHKETKEIFALKKMKKTDMIEQKQLANVRAERDLMALSADNTWLIALYYAFQDEEYLYLVMEYAPGGDLWNLLQSVQLTEDEVRFYIAEIVMAVDSIHQLGYFHRDLKPENILFDRDGHVKLADFGLAKSLSSQGAYALDIGRNGCTEARPLLDIISGKSTTREEFERTHKPKGRGPATTSRFKAETWKAKRKNMAFSVVGTPGYAAPEVMYETGYAKECDWWSLGIMMYEMIYGYHPFLADTVEELCVKILQWKQHLKFPADVPLSPEAVDFLRKLICDAPQRLDLAGIKAHPFFDGVVWEELRDIEAPFIPEIKDLTDTTYFEDFEEQESADEGRQLHAKQRLGAKHVPFVGFTFKRFDAVMDRQARMESGRH